MQNQHDVILAISDLQEPFAHQDALDFVLHVKKTFIGPQTTSLIINVGDEVDQHTLGRWATNPDGRSGGDEFKEAKHKLNNWFREFPKTFVCESNHTYRVFRKASEAGIPSAFMKTIAEAYEAPPGWQWADRWEFDNIIFEHGEFVSGKLAALTAAEQNRKSTVIGHQHAFGGVTWSTSITDSIYGMNTGCLIDVEQYAFNYGRKLRKKPTLGMGVIINGIPFFIPMILNHSKRWVKRL